MKSKIYFFLVYSLYFILAQNPDDQKQKKFKDIPPGWPVIINNVLDDSSSFSAVLLKDTIQYISEGYRVQVLATRYLILLIVLQYPLVIKLLIVFM